MTRRRAHTRGVVGAVGNWHRLNDTARPSAARPPLSEPQEVPPPRQHPSRPKQPPGRSLGVPVPRDPRLAESMAGVRRFDALMGRIALAIRAGNPQPALELLEQAAAELENVLPGHRGGRSAKLTQAHDRVTHMQRQR